MSQYRAYLKNGAPFAKYLYLYLLYFVYTPFPCTFKLFKGYTGIYPYLLTYAIGKLHQLIL